MALPTLVTPLVLPDALEQVSDLQLARYADLIYSRTGIRVSPQKKTLLSNRLRRRLRLTGIEGFEQYYRHLRQLGPRNPEWDAFLQEITTHETYLFRDPAQWDWFQDTFLPACAAARACGGRACLRIWSAACSTGDEAFTAACCIAGTLPNAATRRIQILGTDIGIVAVEQARAAVFNERAMRLVPDACRKRFFNKAKDAYAWQAKPILTQMVAFRQHNLLDRLAEDPFDVVFLKNVLIYFDRDSKRRVMANVGTMVRPGGMLVVGAAEGVADFAGSLVRIQPWLYQRPAA